MRIAVQLAFDERAALRLLNWLAKENARILLRRPDLPGLYESGVYYARERGETWCDYINMLARGYEDCDGLAAARAGELMARGYRALEPGDGGYREARRRRLRSIKAQAMLRTRTRVGKPGLYHVVARYRVAGRWYRDDPSARLGMYDAPRKPR